MYDQVGFYSDNVLQVRIHTPAAVPGTQHDFGGFDFSDVLRNAQAEANARRGSAGSADRNFRRRFRDIFSQFFRGGEDGRGGGEERVAEKAPIWSTA